MEAFEKLSKNFDEFKKFDRKISECDDSEKQKIINGLQKPIKADLQSPWAFMGPCWP